MKKKYDEAQIDKISVGILQYGRLGKFFTRLTMDKRREYVSYLEKEDLITFKTGIPLPNRKRKISGNGKIR